MPGQPAGMPDDTLPLAVQKWLYQLKCRLGCGFMWAQGNIRWGGATVQYCCTIHMWHDVAFCQITLTTCLCLGSVL